MASHFSLAVLELNRFGVTCTAIAKALGWSRQYVSLQLQGKRRLDPAMGSVIAALTNRETAAEILALVPGKS
jgi:hypothetical protein